MAPIRFPRLAGIACALLPFSIARVENAAVSLLQKRGVVVSGNMGQGEPQEQGAAGSPAEGEISYVHLWTSADGETHLADCKVKGLDFKKLPGGESEQYVESLTATDYGMYMTNTIVTQMVGPNPWHHCPQTQFVVTLSGTWFVNTTDGDQRFLPAGSWLFQDDTPKNPAAEPGTRKSMHYSEAVGPCNQMVLQLQRPPVVDQPCPL